MQDYRNLRVWQKAHQLTLATYAVSTYLQKPEACHFVTRCSGRRFRSRRTSLKALVEVPTLISAAFCGTPWVPVMNLSMICFLPEISGSCRCSCTPGSPDRWKKSDGCYRAWCSN